MEKSRTGKEGRGSLKVIVMKERQCACSELGKLRPNVNSFRNQYISLMVRFSNVPPCTVINSNVADNG